MKNIYELSTKQDFFKCKLLYIDDHSLRYYDPGTLQSMGLHQVSEKIFLRDGRVNLRQVVDYCEHVMRMDLLDENQLDQYYKAEKEWKDKHMGQNYHRPAFASTSNNTPNVPQKEYMGQFEEPEFTPPPQIPLKTKVITCTLVTYFTGLYRLVYMPLEEFEEAHQAWMEAQRLDYDLRENN